MDLWTSLELIVQRWKVVVPLLVVTAIASLTLGALVSPDYEARTSLLFTGPGAGNPPVEGQPTTVAPPSNGEVSNPLLGLSASLQSTARAAAEVLQDDNVSRSLRDAGLSSDIEVTVTDRDPIMAITVTAGSGDTALETMRALRTTLDTDLEARQDAAGVPPRERIQVQTLTESNEPRKLFDTRRRAQLVIVALGIVISAVSAFAVEGYTERRARTQRRHAARPTPERGLESEEASLLATGAPATEPPDGRASQVDEAIDGDGSGDAGEREYASWRPAGDGDG